MNFPLISEYRAAILNAEDNLATKSSLRPVFDAFGEPLMTSGNYAVVFKMVDEATGQFYAVKCFLREQERRESSYEKISRALSIYPKLYWTSFQYLEKELFVDSQNSSETEFPVVLMDWIEGTDLGTFVDTHFRDSIVMAKITFEFCKMAKWICGLPIAHGDVKPDNIIVTPRSFELMLVDYDGMFVPEMTGEAPRELGSPNFRHPFRESSIYDSYIDDFAFALISMSLRAITLAPSLYEQFGGPDHLIFHEKDLVNINDSEVTKKIRGLLEDKDLYSLALLFDSALKYGDLRFISLSNFVINNTDNRIGTRACEEHKTVYVQNGEVLTNFNATSETIHLHRPLKVISSFAFSQCRSLAVVFFPDSLETIEADAFNSCNSLIEVHFSSIPIKIDRKAFNGCSSIITFFVPKGTISQFEAIGNMSYHILKEE